MINEVSSNKHGQKSFLALFFADDNDIAIT